MKWSFILNKINPRIIQHYLNLIVFDAKLVNLINILFLIKLYSNNLISELYYKDLNHATTCKSLGTFEGSEFNN